MILIVDDKPENIFALKSLLEIHKFPVDTASSGEEALKKVLKNAYALIILDVQMPGMDGFEVAEAITGYSKAKDIPIIFLSAVNTDKRFVTRGYESGGIDYVTKPIDPDILLLKAKTFYRLYEQTKQLHEIQQALQEEIEFRKKAQAELDEKNTELQSILESLPQIAFTANAKGKVEYVNEQWYTFSTSPLQFPSTHPDDESFLEEWHNALASGQAFEKELRIRQISQEEYRYHLLRIVPVKENDQVVKWVGTYTDIEEQKKSEQKKDEFISIASHELKTPLTSIKAYVQLLERTLAADADENNIKYIKRAQLQIDKLSSLINDLLDISKMDSGKMQFNKKEFDLEQLLNSTIDIIQQTNSTHQIIKTGTSDGFVFGDEVRIEQVIINYLSNAIKYSPGKDKVWVNLDNTPEGIKVSVTDEGMGIPADKQQHVFNKFYRADQTMQGLGIGLYICSEIIKRHQGIFGLTSEQGKGSTFYFILPTITK
jgi:signal transduction histidine kinase/DNA-binding response OmpR family regulator